MKLPSMYLPCLIILFTVLVPDSPVKAQTPPSIATSDARINYIIGPTNPTADLDKLSRIQVTDYTLRDTLTNGHLHVKKVIAQQVGDVYPQAIRKQKGFIPNVYQETIEMQRTDSGYLLTFRNPHHLSAMAARIRIETGGAVRPYSIICIPSDNQVVIKSSVIKATRVFVYGEEVNDFQIVDYESLTALNISATQELGKLVKEQAEAIALLKRQIRSLQAQLKKTSTLEPSTLGK